jgi:4,4'-diapophytoene synthase
MTDKAARYQRDILAKVSRTFALTIPQLPTRLRGVVTNAYLLCRIADTIEDEPALKVADKQYFHALFVGVVNGTQSAERFSRELVPLLPQPTAERDLVAHAPLVLEMTRRYGARQQGALSRCVAVMCDGMPRFEREASLEGLANLAEMRQYCYVVAGVVGEMLTELFCGYVPAIARQRDLMLDLGVSFGRGLQMTNILKDFWEDHDRGVCWLPRDMFARVGVALDQVQRGHLPQSFPAVYRELIGVAHGHLCDALDYTLRIPPGETGIRSFCLIALGLAMQTLKCINDKPDFTTGSQVKVSRQVVARTLLFTRRFAPEDRALQRWFGGLAESLPPPIEARAQLPGVPLPRDATLPRAAAVYE